MDNVDRDTRRVISGLFRKCTIGINRRLGRREHPSLPRSSHLFKLLAELRAPEYRAGYSHYGPALESIWSRSGRYRISASPASLSDVEMNPGIHVTASCGWKSSRALTSLLEVLSADLPLRLLRSWSWH